MFFYSWNFRFKAHLSGANLSQASLRNAYLNKATLTDTNFIGADLRGTDLLGTNLIRVDFTRTQLSGCKINESTLFSKVKGCDRGVNGIYCKETDSAALMTLTPPGNSMIGFNPEVIIENLKSARKLHNISLSFTAIYLLINILKLNKIPILGLSIDVSDKTQFLLLGALAVIISIGLMSITVSFMRSALEATTYINNQDSAMKVGHFPWMLSKYEHGFFPKVQSLMMRTLLVFHPIAYPAVLYLQTYLIEIFLPVNAAKILNVDPAVIWVIWTAYLVLLSLCVRLFVLSQKFQKPILFDPETERKRKSDAAIMNETLSYIAEMLKAKTSTETTQTQPELP